MKEKPNVGSPFFRAFPSDRIPKASQCALFYSHFYNFPHAAIPVNYTTKFQEIIEATMYDRRAKNS
jgi:hypothetical protein